MDLDVVEAFTPPPMGNLSLSEARKLWKDKVISLNFPESIFVEGKKSISKLLLKLLKEAYPGNNFMITITESMPKKYQWIGLLTKAQS